jgi:hypothetical protein
VADIEEPLMPVHNNLGTTALYQFVDSSPPPQNELSIPWPHVLVADAIIPENELEPVTMTLPHVLEANAVIPDNSVSKGGVYQGRVFHTTWLENDPKIEPVNIMGMHRLAAHSPANDPEISDGKVVGLNELSAALIENEPVIRGPNLYHVDGVLGADSLDGEHGIPPVRFVLDSHRFATAMVIGA